MEINNSIINELKAKIEAQAAQIKQLADTNSELMALINNISSEMPDDAIMPDDEMLDLYELEAPVIITREFIEFVAIRKIKNAIIPDVKSNLAAKELTMLIQDTELSEFDLGLAFNRIIDKYIYQRMWDSTDSGVRRAVELLEDLGYQKIETPKDSPIIGPYWERTIGGGTRVHTVYRAPFRLANGYEYLYLKGVCITR